MSGFGVAVALPWVASAALHVYCRRVDRDLTPPWAVIALPTLAAASALSVVASLVAVATVSLSLTVLPIRAVGVLAVCFLLWRLILAMAHLRKMVASARVASAFGREAAGREAAGREAGSRRGTVVVDSPEPDAFAVPSGGGAVVVTTGLVDALSDAELRAVIEHERAHLRFRHSMWTQICEVAAVIDPLLRPVVDRVRHAAERHADEIAARHGRAVTMTALARTALLGADRKRGAASYALPGTGGDVLARVRALSGPPPGRQHVVVVIAGVVVLMLFSVVSLALLDVTQDVLFPEPGEAPTSVLR
ncbi:MAG: M56 family metallopeptidase [Rhodococcus sp. (in: high G+C Gram-positive bacteria)]